MSAGNLTPQKPDFEQLPLNKAGPRGNAWSLFGDQDELGMLNYITPEITHRAKEEIVYGIRISTDLPLDFFSSPTFGRIPLRHEIKQVNDWAVNDDTVTFNPQSSTQWDGFRYFGKSSHSADCASPSNIWSLGYQDRKQYYNGCVQHEIHSTNRNGVHGQFFLKTLWC